MCFWVFDEILFLEVTHAIVAFSIVFRRMYQIAEIAQIFGATQGRQFLVGLCQRVLWHFSSFSNSDENS